MKKNGSPYTGITELADAEQGLTNYYSHIVKLILKNASLDESNLSNISILEFGAGTGFLSELIQDSLRVKVDCLEIDETLTKILNEKGFQTYSSIGVVDKAYDLIFSSNVLEHIQNDLEVLAELSSLLKPHGNLVTYVPAFPILFSELDEAVGHYRRYTKKELMEKLKLSGYVIHKIQFVDSIGFPASLFLRLVGYKSLGNIGGLKSMKFYDQIVFPISKKLDQVGFKKVFGKNLIAHATLRK
jgi:SAM-dependent methyltransferase